MCSAVVLTAVFLISQEFSSSNRKFEILNLEHSEPPFHHDFSANAFSVFSRSTGKFDCANAGNGTYSPDSTLIRVQ